METKVIVIGNEKGGSGKTTTAMHLVISLLHYGYKVATIDLDHRQQSLNRYIENRKNYANIHNLDYSFMVPENYIIDPSKNDSKQASAIEDQEKFKSLLAQVKQGKDFVVIDTPGSYNGMSRVAHSCADIVITPINDSFLDLDLIGKIEAETLNSTSPGIYSEMLWGQKMQKIKESKKELQWFVVRNRLSYVDAHNKQNMLNAMDKLSKRLGFKIAPGFGDRVIFKELFLHGLTLHDAGKAPEVRYSPSMIAARSELKQFMIALNILPKTVKAVA